MSAQSRSRKLAPYLLLMPFLATFVVFMVYPLVLSVVMVTQYTYGARTWTYVGLDNLRHLIVDPLFWKSMWNTVLFASGSLFLQLPLALGLAMLLNRKDLRFRGFFRLIFFAPSLVGLVFVGILAALMFEKRTGLINLMLFRVTDLLFGALPEGGLRQSLIWNVDYPWLQEYVMPALIISALWMYVGFNMIYFLAALQNVNRDIEEAALVDGAGPWQRFLNVTLPAIKPIGTFVVLLSLIGSFQLFELPYILLNNSAGPNNQGLTPVMYLYQRGFEANQLGEASAIGWVLALVLFSFAIGQKLITREKL